MGVLVKDSALVRSVHDDESLHPVNASPFIRAVLAGAVVLLVTVGLDWILLRDQVPKAIIINLSDVFAALIIAVLSYKLFRYQQDRERAMLRRLETISAMNHHIRNALQVISYSHSGVASEKEVQAVRDAVARITWALREVLPNV